MADRWSEAECLETTMSIALAELPPKAVTTDMMAKVRDIANAQLRPLAQEIDREGLYPEGVMRAFGAAGAFGAHLDVSGGTADLRSAIDAMAIAGETCLSTSFCMWCQDALGWYLATSQNKTLFETLGRRVATGAQLGGTGLSNPMKSFFGIEKLRLKGKRVDGGYVVDGRLPWVSNLGKDHFFGAIFELADRPDVRIMAAVDCAGPGVSIQQVDHFVALEGTRTFSVKFARAFIPDAQIIADPVDDYIPKIRAGFILLQAGMAFGVIKGCIDLMKQVERS
ncbi:MAG: acyl-CoA dehydrogenase, partial [Alphaproteobacteria bacterium]|nr:acyl-CoA dehydrogenase [Alphaproteobacteria bacterium]